MRAQTLGMSEHPGGFLLSLVDTVQQGTNGVTVM